MNYEATYYFNFNQKKKSADSSICLLGMLMSTVPMVVFIVISYKIS